MRHWLIIGTVLLGASAHAQYSDTAIEDNVQPGEVCKRDGTGQVVCRYVGQTPVVLEAQQASGLRAWRSIDPHYPTNMPISQRYCLSKKEHVLANFALGAYSGNPNRLLESYWWNGMDDTSAEAVVERLSAVAVNGHWERSVVDNWDGPEKALARVPIYVRWVTDDTTLPTLHFTLRQDQGCWFLSGIPRPDGVVRVAGVYSQGRIIGREAPEHQPASEAYGNEDSTDNFVIIR